MISLDAIAGPGRPRLLIGGDTARSPAASLVRTAAVARPRGDRRAARRRRARLRQLLDLGFPFTLGEQGPFVARGIPARHADDRAPSGPRRAFADAQLHPQRLDELGRAAQSLVGSLDAGLELAAGRIELRLHRHRASSAAGRSSSCCSRRCCPSRSARSTSSPAAGGGGSRSRRRCAACAAGCSSGATSGLLLFVAAKARRVRRGRAAPAAAGRAGARPARPRSRSACSDAARSRGWLVGRERLIPRRPVTFEETLAGHTVALLAPRPDRARRRRDRTRSRSSSCSRPSTPGSGCRRRRRRRPARARRPVRARPRRAAHPARLARGAPRARPRRARRTSSR